MNRQVRTDGFALNGPLSAAFIAESGINYISFVRFVPPLLFGVIRNKVTLSGNRYCGGAAFAYTIALSNVLATLKKPAT